MIPKIWADIKDKGFWGVLLEIFTNEMSLNLTSCFILLELKIFGVKKESKYLGIHPSFKVATHPQYSVNFFTETPDFNTGTIGDKIMARPLLDDTKIIDTTPINIPVVYIDSF